MEDQSAVLFDQSIIKLFEFRMGCGYSGDQPEGNHVLPHRSGKRTTKVDCRRKNTQAIDCIVENVADIKEDITSMAQSVQIAREVLKKHCLFSVLEEQEIANVFKKMFSCTTKQDEYVFMQNQPAVCLFIIEQGEVDVEIDNKYVKRLKRGDAFGELALLYLGKRSASIKSKSPNLKLLGLKSIQFKNIMQSIRTKNQLLTSKLIQKISIFSFFTNKQKVLLANNLTEERHAQGEILFEKNEPAYKFYIIRSGKVSITFNDPNKKDTVLGKLQTFGQGTFRKDGVREGTATVTEDLTCFAINKEKMNNILGSSLQQIIQQNIKKWALKSSPVFQHLENQELSELASKFEMKHAGIYDIIVKEGDKVDSMIIGISGSINVSGPGKLFYDKEFSLWDQQFVLTSATNELVQTSDGVYVTIKFSKLAEWLDILNKRTEARRINQRSSSFKNRVRYSILSSRKILGSLLNIESSDQIKQESLIDFSSLRFIKELGSGQFGLVYLVKDTKSGILFAVKCLDKDAICQQKMEDSTIAQKNILSSVCHPLIVGYYNAYEDDQSIYFFLEFINGVEMFDVIREMKSMSKAIVRFYMGSLVLALEYLHSHDIIYRDIKPENSIINYEGKAFLIDLGTCKVLTEAENYRTSTIIGTPHYMAPEVMNGKGYSFEADYWSLGVILYEFVCGHLPYGDDLDDPWEVYACIVRSDVHFSSQITDNSFKQLVRKLLNKNPSVRGNGKLDSIKDCSYFWGFRWNHLAQGLMYPPYTPKKFRENKNRSFESIQGRSFVDFLNKKVQKQRNSKAWKRIVEGSQNKPRFRQWTSDIFP